MASLCIAKATTMTGHMRERTHHRLALMNQPSRLPSLAPLASQGLHTSPRPSQGEATSWFLALVSKIYSLAYLANWDKEGRPPHKDHEQIFCS
ncbi:hypothetical protein TIFTF001_044843 [Ficus carica]|uniref:Uncharacterized protein n=1 Tax=Ficus carica TaxID=3494 RepID=A0AA88CVV0_FICCA|nr:hypothetical protein TIFTF001_044843 [Ficus carica]